MEEKTLQKCIFQTFNTQEGRVTLAYMLSKAGYFSLDPKQINPDVIAFINSILADGHLALSGNMGKYVNALLKSYDEEGI